MSQKSTTTDGAPLHSDEEEGQVLADPPSAGSVEEQARWVEQYVRYYGKVLDKRN